MGTVNIRVKLNRSVGRAILTSDGVKADLLERGERIAAAANALNLARHFELHGRVSDLPEVVTGVRAQDASSGSRARVHVATVSYQAMEDQMHAHTLERALHAGAG